MAIKLIIWDFASVVLQPVKGGFIDLMAERLEAPLEDLKCALHSPQNTSWDLGELDDDSFYTFLLNELKMPLVKKAILAKFVWNDFQVIPELVEYIRGSRAMYTTALLSNFPAHFHDFTKTVWDISGAFDHTFVSCDIKLLKPDPRAYQYVLDKTGFSAGEAIFIDDRKTNTQAAEEMGIRSIVYQDMQQTIEVLEEILKRS